MDALVAVAVDKTGTLQGFGAFLTVLLQLGCVYLLAFLFNYSGQFIVAGVAERTMHDLRMAVDKKIRRLPLACLLYTSQFPVIPVAIPCDKYHLVPPAQLLKRRNAFFIM